MIIVDTQLDIKESGNPNAMMAKDAIYATLNGNYKR